MRRRTFHSLCESRQREWLMGPRFQVDAARRIRGRLAADYERVLEASKDISASYADFPAEGMAKWYINHALQNQRKAVWWILNRNDLTAAWFLARYVEKYLPGAKKKDVQLEERVWQGSLLRPFQPRYPDYVELLLEPAPKMREYGVMRMRYRKNAQLSTLAHQLHMFWDAESLSYIRRVGEAGAPVADRLAQLGSSLLQAGFSLVVWDREVREMIRQNTFQPEYPLWIKAGESERTLEFLYPNNDTLLHRRIRSLGARWNGRLMEIDVWHWETVEEFAQVYRFRVTKEARKKVEEWRKAHNEAEAVAPAEGEPWRPIRQDPLEMMMRLGRPVPEDLYDNQS